MNDDCTPICPMCGNARHVRANGDHLWYCTLHDMLFDDSGDDGTIGYGDPARIVERNERQRLSRQNQRQARRPAPRQLRGGLGK